MFHFLSPSLTHYHLMDSSLTTIGRPKSSRATSTTISTRSDTASLTRHSSTARSSSIQRQWVHRAASLSRSASPTLELEQAKRPFLCIWMTSLPRFLDHWDSWRRSRRSVLSQMRRRRSTLSSAWMTYHFSILMDTECTNPENSTSMLEISRRRLILLLRHIKTRILLLLSDYCENKNRFI